MDKQQKIIAVTAAAVAAVIAVAVIVTALKNTSKTDNTAVTTNAPVETSAEKSEQKTSAKEENSSAKTGKEDKQESAAAGSAVSSETAPEKKVTPTFMYFISASDAEYEKTNAMLDELQKEYEGRINFDIRNIDENPEDKKNFPVDGQTPALIMLNTSNDISGLEFKCNDKETLVKDIENALK